MGKRRSGNIRPFESAARSGAHDGYIRIFYSMLDSPAWNALTPRQQALYIVCKRQPFTSKNPVDDYEDLYSREDRNNYFYANWGRMEGKALYGKAKRSFYWDLRALCDKGFIECLYNGKSRRQKSIFCFSTKWKEYTNKDET